MTSVRTDEELPPCKTEPVPGCCKMDPSLAKAEQINDVGIAFMITYLRKGKKWHATAAEGEK